MHRGFARNALVCLFFLCAAAGCVEGVEPPPSCAQSRSHCVAQVTLGARFGCALLVDRTVWCWGRNDESQLGYPTTDLCPEELSGGQTRSVACHAFPFQVAGLDRATRVSAGGAFACALRDDNAVRCWGSNSAGQLGNGLNAPSPVPVAVRGLSGVTALATGARHACAVSGGRVLCWGANDRGQLGQAASSRRCAAPGGEIPCEVEPVAVAGLEGVTAVTAGDAHTCVRTTEGLALCWGDGRWGQLGVGIPTADAAPMPQAVLAGDLPLEAIRSLASGPNHTCARTDEGAVWCWGRNDHGELGTPVEPMAPEGCVGPCGTRPVVVPGLPYDAGPDAGGDASDDASSDADAAIDASSDADATTDASLDADRDVDSDADVDASLDADVADGADDAAPRPRDVVIPPSMAPRGVTAGGTFTCAVLDDGTARCWGDDREGQLGDGRRESDPQGPSLVIATPGAARNNPLQNVASIAAGDATACALLVDGSLRCWGSNASGALGNGNTSVQSGPVPVTW